MSPTTFPAGLGRRRVTGRPLPAAASFNGADALKPTAVELIALCVLVGFYLIADAVLGESSYTVVNIVGPLLMVTILGFGAWRLVRYDGRNLWSPLLWFRLSTIVYFGIGTYLVFIIDASSRSYVEALFWFFDADVFKLNLIVAVSALVVLTSAGIAVKVTTTRRLRQAANARQDIAQSEHSLLPVAFGFVAIGFTLNYAVKIPYDFGWITTEVPGSVLNLTRLRFVGIFLLTLWSLRHRNGSLIVIAMLAGVELFSQVLLFSKGDFLIALILFLLAFLWHKVTAQSLVAAGVLLLSAFALLQPIVADGRRQMALRYGNESQAGFVERYEIVRGYFENASFGDNIDNGSTAWTRLSYVNAATLVIDRYDSGFPADWPSLLPAVFVPRVLWPDKPIISDVGKDIYELATGRRSSQAGAGVFADAYWAMGWMGIAVFMPVYGLILGALATTSASILFRGQWLFLPVVLMGLRLGARTDGHYLADVAGGSVILLGTFVALLVVHAVVKAVHRRMPMRAGVTSRNTSARYAFRK